MSEQEFNRVFANNLKKRLSQSGMTRAEFADKIGVGVSSVGFWTAGTKMPRMDKIDKMCSLFHCKRSDLLEDKVEENTLPPYDNVAPITTHKLPVLGSIACGQPIFMEEQFEFYVEVGTEVKADYLLRAKGDSMIGAGIHDNDIIFIRSQPTVENGQMAAVAIGDSVTLKRVYYYPESQKLVLQAENPKYEPMVYVGKELEEVRILGRAIAFQSDIL